MVIKRINSNDIYISESTKELVRRGFTNKDSLVNKTELGFSLSLEPIFVKNEVTLKNDKNKARELPFIFEEYLIFDFEKKGSRRPSIIGDKVFIYGTNQAFDFKGELVKTFVEFESEHAYGTFDKQSDLFYVVSQDKIYVYNLDLNLLYQIDEFKFKGKSLAVSFYQTIQITKEYLICGYGSKYSKSFVVKYINGTLAKQLPLEKGFTIVASNSNIELVATYHESKGIIHLYNKELELIKEIVTQKKLSLYKIGPNGKHLVFSSNSSNNLTVLDIESLEIRDFKVHPFGKNYSFKPKDIFRYINNFWFSDDSEKIIIAGDKYLLNLIDLETQSSKLFNGHELVLDMFYNGIEDVKFNSNNKLILTSASDYQIIIWSYDGGLVGRLIGHSGTVSSFEISDNFDKIVSSSVDGTVRFWNRSMN